MSPGHRSTRLRRNEPAALSWPPARLVILLVAIPVVGLGSMLRYVFIDGAVWWPWKVLIGFSALVVVGTCVGFISHPSAARDLALGRIPRSDGDQDGSGTVRFDGDSPPQGRSLKELNAMFKDSGR